jgi:hypothetical protein
MPSSAQQIHHRYPWMKKTGLEVLVQIDDLCLLADEKIGAQILVRIDDFPLDAE